jgi:hypothetical protein
MMYVSARCRYVSDSGRILLGFSSLYCVNAVAAPYTGGVELVFWAALLAPLVLLLLLGSATSGIKGAAVGASIFAIGLVIFLIIGSVVDAIDSAE